MTTAMYDKDIEVAEELVVLDEPEEIVDDVEGGTEVVDRTDQIDVADVNGIDSVEVVDVVGLAESENRSSPVEAVPIISPLPES